MCFMCSVSRNFVIIVSLCFTHVIRICRFRIAFDFLSEPVDRFFFFTFSLVVNVPTEFSLLNLLPYLQLKLHLPSAVKRH